MQDSKSIKEERIRKITSLYYSRKDVQEAIFNFSQDREISPRYFEGFGKRPDSFQYKNEIMAMVNKGATSFHCSEEIWKDSLKIETGMKEHELNSLRKGWDLLLDIDSKYIDYSKILAKQIIKFLGFRGIKNIGVKFSGSKGFHILVPWKAFPKEINGVKTSDMFPDWPRIILKYISEKTKSELIKEVSKLSSPNKYVRDYKASEEVIPDLVLVSSRHLFRMPYSLHEKTSLSSCVLDKNEIDSFDMKDADPLKVKVKEFMPDSEEGEATELLREALDWNRETNPEKEEQKHENKSFQPVKITNLSEKNFPPCIKKILQGIEDGKKRALFILISFFRSLGLDRSEIEKKIREWNEKNESPLKEGYLTSQFSWNFRKPARMPPNCKEFYQGIGVCQEDSFCKKIKNPVNYTTKKHFNQSKGKTKASKSNNKNNTNFKNKK